MQEILIGANSQTQLIMDAAMGNRHGMISGATGTGKTISLQILAEGYSRLGVPVFMADIKGDLSGIAKAGAVNEKIKQRVQDVRIDNFQPQANPTVFWDVFARNGHPARTTISEMGPLLLSHLLELNDTQTGILYSGFKIADDQGMLLLDLKDLRAMLSWMGSNAKTLRMDYGNISAASIGAIQRRLLILEEQGASDFFGEPALQLENFCQTDEFGHGIISVLDASDLSSKSPRLYAAFLLWLLSDLYETMPEIGDADKPKLVLFFDEAHLLFDRAPRVLVDKIEQIVRLIRSKGVGIYFISQSPLDIPEDVLGQLGLKIQHALRAYTPKDRKVIKAVADTFRSNPELDTVLAIKELKTGEALVSVLNKDGSPTPVERILIRPPESQMGALSPTERQETIQNSPYYGHYEQVIDRESAYELLRQRATTKIVVEGLGEATTKRGKQSSVEELLKSAARSFGSQLGKQIVRGVMGALFAKR